MNVVAYYRVSTENQKREGTINIQKKDIQNFSNNNGYKILSYFSDEGISGSLDLDNRPGLYELFDFIETNKVEGVIVWKLDRLARDLYLQETLIKQLDKLRVRLISTKEPDLNSNDPMRKAFRQFIGIVSELEKNFITMRLTAGRLKKAKDGKYAGGKPALGYKSRGGELTLDSEEVLIIKKIYYMYKRKKMSMGAIAKYLNENNYHTVHGGKWYSSTVRYILNNKIYKGNLSYDGNVLKRKDLNVLK